MASRLPLRFRLLDLRYRLRSVLSLGGGTLRMNAAALEYLVDSYTSVEDFYADWKRIRDMDLLHLRAALSTRASFFDEALFTYLAKQDRDAVKRMALNPHMPEEGAEWVADRSMTALEQPGTSLADDHAADTLGRLLERGHVTFTPRLTAALTAYLKRSKSRTWSEGREALVRNSQTPANVLDALAAGELNPWPVTSHMLPLLTHPNGGMRFWTLFHEMYIRMGEWGPDAKVLEHTLTRMAPSAAFPGLWRSVYKRAPEEAIGLLAARSADDMRALGLTVEELTPYLHSTKSETRLGAVFGLGSTTDAPTDSVAVNTPVAATDVPTPDPHEDAHRTHRR